MERKPPMPGRLLQKEGDGHRGCTGSWTCWEVTDTGKGASMVAWKKALISIKALALTFCPLAPAEPGAPWGPGSPFSPLEPCGPG
ncbi:Protein PCOTH, partial [Ophiophagus hannah]